MSAIGDRIKTLREQRGISQNRLAKMAGISQSGLSSIESSTKSPSIDIVTMIASALNVPMVDLLEESEQQKKPTAANVPDELLNSPIKLEALSVFSSLSAEDQQLFIELMRSRGKQ